MYFKDDNQIFIAKPKLMRLNRSIGAWLFRVKELAHRQLLKKDRP